MTGYTALFRRPTSLGVRKARAMMQFDTTQWLLFAIAASVAIIAFCFFLTMGVIVGAFRYLSRRTSFSQDAQALLDEGLLTKLIELCHGVLDISLIV